MNNAHECFGKYVRVTLNTGQVFEGTGEYYTSALDNPNGLASVCIGDIEFYENEIASIEMIATIAV